MSWQILVALTNLSFLVNQHSKLIYYTSPHRFHRYELLTVITSFLIILFFFGRGGLQDNLCSALNKKKQHIKLIPRNADIFSAYISAISPFPLRETFTAGTHHFSTDELPCTWHRRLQRTQCHYMYGLIIYWSSTSPPYLDVLLNIHVDLNDKPTTQLYHKRDPDDVNFSFGWDRKTRSVNFAALHRQW